MRLIRAVGRFAAGAVLVPVCAGCASAAGESAATAAAYPTVTLANGRIAMTVYLPEAGREFYRGPRFDWSGMVESLVGGKHRWFGPWKTTPHDPAGCDDVTAIAGEFGMGVDGMPPPLNYDDAPEGGAFLKIGVGWERKVKEAGYRFGANYEIVETAPWRTKTGKRWVEFRQEMAPRDGYGYFYFKRIELAEKGAKFTVYHSLRNTGSKTVRQTHYIHNFIALDGLPVGPEWRTSFPFEPKPRKDMKGMAAVEGRDLVISAPIAKGALHTILDGFDATPASNGATVRHAGGMGLSFAGDRPIVRFHFFATPTVVCPEPFVEMEIRPGATFTWRYTYTLSVPAD